MGIHSGEVLRKCKYFTLLSVLYQEDETLLFYVSSAQRPWGRAFEEHRRNGWQEEHLWGLKCGKVRSEETQRDSLRVDVHIILECRLMLIFHFLLLTQVRDLALLRT